MQQQLNPRSNCDELKYSLFSIGVFMLSFFIFLRIACFDAVQVSSEMHLDFSSCYLTLDCVQFFVPNSVVLFFYLGNHLVVKRHLTRNRLLKNDSNKLGSICHLPIILKYQRRSQRRNSGGTYRRNFYYISSNLSKITLYVFVLYEKHDGVIDLYHFTFLLYHI